jgi:uncharacterized protein
VILYLHGFNSSPQSTKARVLGQALAAAGLGARFCCPALPHRPAEAIALAGRILAPALAAADAPVVLVGSSLGGYYAVHLAETYGLRAVLLNPAVNPLRDLGRYLGPQRNLYTGEPYELTTAHIDELRALEVGRVDPQRYLLIVETGDEVLDYREAVTRFAGARQIVIEGGNHNLVHFPEHLPAVLDFVC